MEDEISDVELELKSLIVDRRMTLKSIISKSKRVIGVDSESGEPIFLIPRKMITDKQAIGLYLLGKYFSHELRMAESPNVELTTLSYKLGLDPKVCSARIAELVKEKKACSVSRGIYKSELLQIEELLDEIPNEKG